MRPVSLPFGRIPFREPPCPGRQVGEGVSPTLDAGPNITLWRLENLQAISRGYGDSLT
jgi:hypothetical protein